MFIATSLVLRTTCAGLLLGPVIRAVEHEPCSDEMIQHLTEHRRIILWPVNVEDKIGCTINRCGETPYVVTRRWYCTMLLHVARSTCFVSWSVPATCADTLFRDKRHTYAGTTRPNGTKDADLAWVNRPSAQRYPVSKCVLLPCNDANNSFAEKEHPGSKCDEIWPQLALRHEGLRPRVINIVF